ncbi:hypothetical protein [Bacillus thuringiensis]|nr:hypothetical protein [Bacillus thuringiensis]
MRSRISNLESGGVRVRENPD